MKRLLLIRHAKSCWSHPDLDDKLRPLNSRGYQAAQLIGRHAIIQDNPPDHVLCSSAVRTYSTAQALLAQLDMDSRYLKLEDELYLASTNQLYAKLANQPSDIVWLVGHNPAMETLALQLGADIPAFPTLAVACFDIPEGELAAARLIDFVTPRELENG